MGTTSPSAHLGPLGPMKQGRVKGGSREDSPPFWGRCMESQSLVTSAITLSIYSRGAQRGKGTCPESHSRALIGSQDSGLPAQCSLHHISHPTACRLRMH